MHLFSTFRNNERPKLLTVLCIASFIGSGLTSVSNLFIYFNHGALAEAVNSEAFKDFGFDLSLLLDVKPVYFLLAGLLNVISFTGVRKMWQLQRGGFHIYAITQLLMLIVSTIYIYKPTGVFPMFDLLITSLFILLYLRFRDIMS